MITLKSGAHLYRISAGGNWNATMPISEDEQRTEVAGGVVRHHTGEEFTARELYVHASRTGGEPWWQVMGPNIRKDGSAGKYMLRRAVTREYAAQAYPRTLAYLDRALGELAGVIRADADEACKEISLALPG
jgi:hypothetical protein